MREAKELSEATSDYYAQPLSDNLFEWHFTVRGPSDTEFDGGIYHGRILLPPEYPMKPPNIIILTPNGRFETGKKICLSISGYHPETWQPSWSIRTALLAIIGFMPTPGQGTIASLDYTPDERKKLAKKSVNYECEECCSVGTKTSSLLKSREEERDEDNLKKKQERAEEAKRLAMQMSFKAEGENKNKKGANLPIDETPTIQETTEEKAKRIRKEASKRMQQKFRERLHARTSGIIEQINAKPEKSLKENRTSNSSGHMPRPAHETALDNRTAATGGRNQDEATQIQPQAGNEVRDGMERSYFDWLIAVIIIAILAILYRRAAAYLNFLPGSVSSHEGSHEDQTNSELLKNLDDM